MRYMTIRVDELDEDPSPVLARKDRGDLIILGNFEDDLDKIADCDWIVEVIVEQLAPKQKLMAKVEALRKPGRQTVSGWSAWRTWIRRAR